MNRKLNWVLTAKGDGYWGLENGDKVRCTKITSYTDIVYDGSKEITETFYKVYHRGLKGALPYTDSGIIKELRRRLKNPRLDWTEQGMQSHSYMHIIDGSW